MSGRTCAGCEKKYRHWCYDQEKWIPPQKCSRSYDGCKGYDEHYCTVRKRHISLCSRCDTDDRMCFCC